MQALGEPRRLRLQVAWRRVPASPRVRRAAEIRLFEIAAYRTLAAWQRSPATAEAQERAALAGDRAAVEALAAGLG